MPNHHQITLRERDNIVGGRIHDKRAHETDGTEQEDTVARVLEAEKGGPWNQRMSIDGKGWREKLVKLWNSTRTLARVIPGPLGEDIIVHGRELYFAHLPATFNDDQS
jgi:hypothetical protein